MKRADIVAELAAYAGAQDLDRHLLAGRTPDRGMDLCDRGGGDRFAQIADSIPHFGAKFGLDFGAGLLKREGRETVLEIAQLADQFLANDIAPGREDLPEFDIGRSHSLQRAGNRGQRGIAGPPERANGQGHRAHGKAGPAVDFERVEDLGHRAGPLERRAGAEQMPDVIGRAKDAHSRQPECRATMPIEKLR